VLVGVSAAGGGIAKVGLTTYHPIVIQLLQVAKLEAGVDIGRVDILTVGGRI